MRLFKDASIYWVTIVMCPHYKLEWFRMHGYSELGSKPSLKTYQTISQNTKTLSRSANLVSLLLLFYSTQCLIVSRRRLAVR
ncbi:hypothetical protein RSOL_061770 [Rhizoctonia solani AG-3 Rhs1AP]|nr:hypothetical protein RSOL_061770 [Rhizoctonia solani AG-3 Rhs1AP]